MGTDARQGLGKTGEELAAQHLQRLGYEVLARNHRTRFGELDIVASDGESIVFVEVKTRSAGSGRPWDSLHDLKRAQVRRMAAAYLSDVRDRPRAAELRFDAIGVILGRDGSLVELEHIQGAF
jgi:putative endonuclease